MSDSDGSCSGLAGSNVWVSWFAGLRSAGLPPAGLVDVLVYALLGVLVSPGFCLVSAFVCVALVCWFLFMGVLVGSVLVGSGCPSWVAPWFGRFAGLDFLFSAGNMALSMGQVCNGEGIESSQQLVLELFHWSAGARH